MTTRVGLVGCAAMKLGEPAPARNLYRSQLFRKAAAYAEATCAHWYVLSAKHGLVAPNTVLAPYDVQLGHHDGPPIQEWAAGVAEQLRNAMIELNVEDPQLVLLCGQKYRTVVQMTTMPCIAPMRGMGIGQQLGWLTRELKAAV